MANGHDARLDKQKFFLLTHIYLSHDLPYCVWTWLCMSNLVATMGDSSGASNSMHNPSGASRGDVAETESAFQGWKYKHYLF